MYLCLKRSYFLWQPVTSSHTDCVNHVFYNVSIMIFWPVTQTLDCFLCKLEHATHTVFNCVSSLMLVVFE